MLCSGWLAFFIAVWRMLVRVHTCRAFWPRWSIGFCWTSRPRRLTSCSIGAGAISAPAGFARRVARATPVSPPASWRASSPPAAVSAGPCAVPTTCGSSATSRPTTARLALFHAWQDDRIATRGWERAPLTAKDYWMRFAFATPFARELAYYDDDAGGRLVMVSLCDQTPNAWSAVFCFYDPAYARLSPGIANILNIMELALAHGQRHVYLGYCVLACPSLCYKDDFRPHETLLGLPRDDETPRWVRTDRAAGELGVSTAVQLELW
jgi:hypothetical protein